MMEVRMRLLFPVVLTASIALLSCGGDSEESRTSAQPPATEVASIVSGPAATQPPATESVALDSDAAMSCVERYSLDTLALRAFAFDGAVTHIGTEEDLLYAR
jgi:hypothetical protein